MESGVFLDTESMEVLDTSSVGLPANRGHVVELPSG